MRRICFPSYIIQTYLLRVPVAINPFVRFRFEQLKYRVMLQTKMPDAVHNVLCLPEACVLTMSRLISQLSRACRFVKLLNAPQKVCSRLHWM